MGASRLLLRSAAARLTSACTSSSAAAIGSAGGATAASGLAVALHPAWRQATGDLPIAASAARHYWAAATASAAQAHVGGLPGLPTRSQAARQPHSVAPTGLQQRSQTTTDGGASLPPAHQLLLDRNLLLDTLDTMKKLEAMGLTREQAEALTRHLTTVLCSNKEKLEEMYASKVALEKSILEQEAKHAGFRSEVLKSQELQVATFTRDTERLQINLEKIRSEIRYEIDKLTASQRLDLNLEKGRMRDELQMLRDKSNELEIKMDKEVNSLKAAMEQSKNDTVKYVLGLMLALMTAGLGAARLLMH
ncbi:hypothetical protein ABPG77_005194 [Micractinium sp. CCAP 211/92]